MSLFLPSDDDPPFYYSPDLYYAFDQSILSDRDKARKKYASKNSVCDDRVDFNVDLEIYYYDDDDDEETKSKKRKNYYRYTPSENYRMEDLFKETPDPDEKTIITWSRNLGLHPKQVKFWINMHTSDIKERINDKPLWLISKPGRLLEDDKLLMETFKNGTCPKCGFSSSSKDAASYTNEQHLHGENAKLTAEVIAKLRTSIGKYPQGTSPTNSCTTGNNDHENRSLELRHGVLEVEKSRIMTTVNLAMEELVKMASAGQPLWVSSFETGREILNYDQYLNEFPIRSSNSVQQKRCIDASRHSDIVFMGLPQLVRCFMNVKKYEELFPSMISKAGILNFICNGEGANGNGAVQLMFAELQMLTPLVTRREVYFVRFSKQLYAGIWAIVDISIDNLEKNIDASLARCRKRPSGCIIEDKSNGQCKVTWIEHMERGKTLTHSMYLTIINSGLAFGARHWMSNLKQQCEHIAFFLATNLPTTYSSGIVTPDAKKSIMKLAYRMTRSFCQAAGSSSCHVWKKIPSKTGDDIRVTSWENINAVGEPVGVILCVASSIWLPVSHTLLFDFLRDESRRNELNVMSTGDPLESIANLAKSRDKINAISIHAIKSDENFWLVQDSFTNIHESMVVFSPVGESTMRSVMAGCDSSQIPILPSGFSIVPDRVETKPMVITSKEEYKSWETGSILTAGIQRITSDSPGTKICMESVERISELISTTFRNIKAGLQCEDQRL